MKKLTRLVTIAAALAILSLPIAAKNLNSEPGTPGALGQDQCTPENKEAYYKTFLDNRTADQPKAYDSAKKYLACPPGEVTENSEKILNYLKKWVGAYEEGTRKNRLPQLIYNDKKYPEAYALGREIVTAEPDNLKALIDLGANGYLLATLKNPQLNNEAVGYARKAIEMLDAGKTVDNWQPLSGKEEAVAYLNYTIGSLTLDQDPSNALKNLIKAAQFETPLKKSPYTYAFIAGAYEQGPYAKQSEEYKRNYTGKDETPESKLALANINQLIDRMIDGYARAVALAGTDARYTGGKAVWTESLSTWYKFRHNQSDAGLNQMVADILKTPLPPEPTPLTSLPAAAPTSNPVGTSGPTTTGSTTSTTTPAANKGTAPAVNSKTAGAKPHRNHP